MVLFLVPFMSLKSIQKEREYTKFVIDERLCYYEPSKNKTEKTFVEELSYSLNQKQKSIHPKFFYDKSGSELFEKICKLPEYYLTRTEISILNKLDDKLSAYMDEEFRLVELGSGSSYKTRILISIFEKLIAQKQREIQAKNGNAQQAPTVDPRATAWAQKSENSWFGRDEAMTAAAFAIDKKMQEEGIDPVASDYYSVLDERIKKAFPHKFEQEENKSPPVQAVGRTSAGANPTTKKSKKVKLTSSQQAIAKKLGVPLEEYAKYV